jgi:hypothetical protein
MAVRLSVLRAGRRLPPGRFLVLISLAGWVDPRAIVRLEGLGKLKKIYLIGTRSRYLPACSTVPQPTTQPLGINLRLNVSHVCSPNKLEINQIRRSLCHFSTEFLSSFLSFIVMMHIARSEKLARSKGGSAVRRVARTYLHNMVWHT